MDRDAYIRSLGSDAWQPVRIEAFFRGVPRRAPGGVDSGPAAEARERIGLWIAELNAIMLGRALDPRVPRDIDALAEMVADRMARYTSADWARRHEGRSLLDHARGAMAEIAADLRLIEPDWDDDARDEAGAAGSDAPGEGW